MFRSSVEYLYQIFSIKRKTLVNRKSTNFLCFGNFAAGNAKKSFIQQNTPYSVSYLSSSFRLVSSIKVSAATLKFQGEMRAKFHCFQSVKQGRHTPKKARKTFIFDISRFSEVCFPTKVCMTYCIVVSISKVSIASSYAIKTHHFFCCRQNSDFSEKAKVVTLITAKTLTYLAPSQTESAVFYFEVKERSTSSSFCWKCQRSKNTKISIVLYKFRL